MQFYEQILSYFLNKHHVVQIQSSNLVSSLFIIYYLELISLTLDFDETAADVPTLINLLFFFDYLRNICKPYIFLQQYQKFRLYCFILPAMLLLFQLIGLIVDQLVQKVIEKIIKISKQERKEYKMFETEKLLSLLFQTHQYIFSLYSVDLFFISVVEAQKSNMVIIMVFSIILLTLELVFVFLNIICSQSIHFNSSPLHVSQPSKLYALNYILILFSILISTYDADWADILRYSLNLIIFGVYLKFEIQKKTSELQIIVLVVLSLGLTYNFSGLILLDGCKEEQIGIIFIFCPFVLNIMMKLQSHQNRINFTKNRKINEIYNNLSLIQESKSNKSINQLDILIMLRMKSDFGNDPFNSELLLFNDKIIKSKNETKAHWYLKYIAIKIVNAQATEALSLIHNFKHNLLYCEINKQFVKVFFQLSFIQSLQLEKIKLEVYEKLYYNTTKNYDIFGRMVSNFIVYKIKITRTQKELQQIFVKKEKIYQQLIESKMLTKNEIFNESRELLKEALAIQGDLKLQLFNNKTYRVQQLSILLHVEFFNNVLQAELLKNYQLLNEEVKQNYLENMEFLGMRINDENEDITLFEVSQDFLIGLGYRKVKKLNEIQFKNLFPHDFYPLHQNLVKQFLQTGKNKLLEKTQEIIIRGNNDIYYYTSFQLTIQPNDVNGLQFYGFIKILEEQPKTILINKSKIIVGITTSFQKLLEQLNINSQKLILSDVRKLIKNYSQFKLNKYDYLYFIDNQQEFTVYLKERLNLIELQIVDGIGVLMQEQDSFIESENRDLNEESEVIIPKISSMEDIYSPKSTLTKRDQTKLTLLRTDTKQFFTIKSKADSKKNSEPQQEIIQQFQSKLSAVEKQENIQIDQASSKFSRGFLDHSIYFQKYSQLDQFVSTIRKQQIYFFIVFLLIGLFMNFIFQIVSIGSFLPQFNQVTQDADSLSVKSYFITPIHSCLVSQYATIYYLIYHYYGLISEEVLFKQIEFSQDSVYKSFNFLKDSFTLELSNSNLQPFFTDSQISMYQVDGDTVVSRNLSLKNALLFFYEAQYFILQENDSLNGTIKVNITTQLSNNFVYYMANILTVDDYFNDLSQMVQEYVSNRSAQLSNSYTVFFLKLTFLQLLLFLIASSYLIKMFYSYQNYFKLFSNVNIHSIKREIQQINKLKQLLSSDNAYSNYNFEVNSWEKEIQASHNFYNQKINQHTISGVNYQPPLLQLLAIVVVLCIIFLVPITVLQIISQSFLEKYSNSCLLLQSLSEMSSSIPAVYELKDSVYQINFKLAYYFYVDDEMAAQYLQKVLSELEKVQTFIKTFPQIDYDTLLISDQFEAVRTGLASDSLCNYLVHYSKEFAQYHCDIAYNGVMNLGLISTISEIYKQVYEENVNTDGFSALKRANAGPYEELEVALIASDAFVYCQRALYNDIVNRTDQMVSIHQIINYTYIFVNLIVAGIILNFFFPYFLQQQKIVRHMIFLVPKYQFYLDSKFETDFRLLVIKQN